MQNVMQGSEIRPVGKAQTNWHFIVWPILFLWLLCAVYVFASEYRSQVVVVLPLLMVAATGLVFLANAIAGSATRAHLDMVASFGHATACTECGISGCQLELIDYEYCLFLYALSFHWFIRGKLCRECAVRLLNTAFLKNVVGCALCPPLIIWMWLKRNRLLEKYSGEFA